MDRRVDGWEERNTGPETPRDMDEADQFFLVILVLIFLLIGVGILLALM